MSENLQFTMRLPQPIGNVVSDEIILFYDRPLVFTCKNETGDREREDLFLVQLVDDRFGVETWLFTTLEYPLYTSLMNGEICLREATLRSNTGYLVKISNIDTLVEEIAVDLLQDHQLPDEGFYIKEQTNRSHQILFKDWHYQCGDRCCDEYGTALYINGVQILRDVSIDPDRLSKILRALKIHHTIEIEGAHSDDD